MVMHLPIDLLSISLLLFLVSDAVEKTALMPIAKKEVRMLKRLLHPISCSTAINKQFI